MNGNIIRLPRPIERRPTAGGLGFYVRVARNDHKEMLDLLATGEKSIFGIVIDAQYSERHEELITEAQRRNLDIVFDPKTQPLGFPGGHTQQLASLPWALDRHHNVTDFDGKNGCARAKQIVEAAVSSGSTQLLGPTHLLNGPNDQWLRRDITMMQLVADEISRSNAKLDLIYSLAIPIDVFRRRSERAALMAAIADAPCDSIWLKIENFGDDATGEKTSAYIEACRDFHERGIPIVADHVGGLPGLAALAFGAVGGICHGVTVNQHFRAANWRRVPDKGFGGSARRVYLPQIDMFMKPAVASEFIRSSPRIRALCGCRDTHCCPHGVRDMIDRPARHALYQRAREIDGIGLTPQSVRVSRYLDDRVRRVSDDVAALAGLTGFGAEIRKSLQKKQGEVSRFRQAMAHLAESAATESIALAPSKRSSRK